MKKPDEGIAEQLWQNVCGDGAMPMRIRALLTLKGKKREEAIMAFCRIMYVAGVERGYDLGYHVFGDGDDDAGGGDDAGDEE